MFPFKSKTHTNELPTSKVFIYLYLIKAIIESFTIPFIHKISVIR